MNLFDVGVGVAIGLGLAAGGWTFAKIGSWLSAKARLLEGPGASYERRNGGRGFVPHRRRSRCRRDLRDRRRTRYGCKVVNGRTVCRLDHTQ